MPGESLSFSITASDRASSSFREVGRAAEGAAVKMDLAAASAKLWNDTTLKQGKAASTSTAAMKSHANAANLLADAENVLAGRATKTTKLMADQGHELDSTGRSAESAAARVSLLAGTGGFPGGGIGALVAAGVALSPVIATVGTGLLGFGAAAVGAAAPILKAAKATGGLAANMSKLSPEQQKVATGLLGLGTQFSVFEKALEPQVLGVFNQGIRLAGHLLTDVQPVAKATGTALGGLLGRIDREFASGAWQQFFQFMARTAGPDIQLLGTTFVNLTATLPPLLELLQPTATDLLVIAAAATKLTQVSAETGQSLDNTGQHMNTLQHVTWLLRTVLFSPGVGLYQALKLTGVVAASTGSQLAAAAVPVHHLSMVTGDLVHPLGEATTLAGSFAYGTVAAGEAAHKAKPKVLDLSGSITTLNASMTTLVGNLLTLQGSDLAWRQSLQAVQAQLRSNTAGLEGNTKNALANRQAVLASTQAAIQFASQELTTGRNIDGASRTVRAQIGFLQGLHDKSAFVRDEIKALRHEEQLLEQQRLSQRITVTGFGKWSIAHGGGPQGMGVGRAAGWLVPGAGTGDTVPAMLTPGEAVVPKHLTPAVAPFLRANKVPGFAAGGIVGSYAGNVAGLKPWVSHNDAATIQLIDAAVARATFAGMRAAQAAASSMVGGSGGPASASARQFQAYALSLFPAHGWSSGLFPALVALWNGESGWNNMARNPSSGAFGIPQALPPGKMGALAASGNGAAQIRWGENYIASVYGNPGSAYNVWLSRSPHWYGSGLRDGLFTRPTLIGVGERGPEMVNITPGRAGGGGNTYVTVNVQVGHGTHPVAAAQEIVKVLNTGAMSGVKLRTSILGPG